MRVRPECVCCCRRDRRKGPAREATVAVELLQQRLRAGNGRLCDREVSASDGALEALRLGQEGGVRECASGEVEEFGAGVLWIVIGLVLML
jgi:hypothetical protein